MIVNVVMFAAVREIAGTSQLKLELSAGSCVSDVKNKLVSQHPELESILSKASFSVNHEFEPIETQLNDGDEVGVIPPVSGG